MPGIEVLVADPAALPGQVKEMPRGTPGEVEAMVGHAVGGVCPFAVNPGVKIYLDASLRRFETVFPACGSSNSAIELTISELEQYSRFDAWVDVCKGWRAEGEG